MHEHTSVNSIDMKKEDLIEVIHRKFGDDGLMVLTMIDGSKSLRDLLISSNVDPKKVASVLKFLYERGFLTFLVD